MSKSKQPARTAKSKTKAKQKPPSKSVEPPLSPSAFGGRRGDRSVRRKHLDERLKVLHHRAMMIEDELRTLDDNRFYRVCIFGSARIKPETEAYNEVFELARMLTWEGIDILTGGGPGLMEAANIGAQLGRQEKNTKTLSFGLPIQLEWEPESNRHLDVKRHHHRFSSRLDDFMRLSHAIIATPGGIGTLLEIYFSWQLIQVKHMTPRPIVLMGKDFWTGLVDWMRAIPTERGLISAKDFDCLKVVDTPEQVLEIITAHYKEFLTENTKKHVAKK